MVKRTIRNFVVANACALLPLWWVLFGWMPDQVKIAMRDGQKAPYIVADGLMLQGEVVGEWKSGTVWRFYLREGMKWKQLSFLLPEGTNVENVEGVSLQKWKLFLLTKAGTELEPSETEQNEWKFVNPQFSCMGFASHRIAWGLAGLETLLLGLAWMFAKWRRDEHWKTLFETAVPVTLVLTVLMQVALPIQSYLANQSSFPFSSSVLAGAVTLRFLCCLVLGFAAVALLARCFGRWVFGAILAFAICVYLESGILSAGLPDLNGDWVFFKNRARAFLNAGVWMGVFAGCTALHPVLKRHYGCAALCLLAMVVASMFDVKREEHGDTSKLIVHDFLPIETVIRNVTYSTTRNVLVFVIDSLEREQAHAIMEDPETGAELRGKFQGFTEYVDNVGAGHNSLIGVANLFTGNYPESQEDLFDYFESIYSSQSILRDYLDEGADVYMATAALGFGYSNRHGESRQTKSKIHEPIFRKGCFHTPGQDGQGWTLSGVTRFRWLPFLAKAQYVYLAERSMPEPDFNLHEWVVYPALEAAETISTEKVAFVFVHTRGVHGPILYNRDGKRLPQVAVGENACREIGIFVMKQLGDLLDTFREKGIFDNSLILVLADHGTQGDHSHSPDVLPNNGRPFLWVKPNDSRHVFKTSGLPTSHARVSALLREASRRPLDEENISSILTSNRRKYRNLHGGVGPEWEDWIVLSNGHIDHVAGRLKGGTSSQLRPLALARYYSLDKGSMVKNKVSVEFQNTMFWNVPTLLYDTPEVKFRFRVPESGQRYSLHLALKYTNAGHEDRPGACMKFRQANRNMDWQRCPVDYHVGFALSGLNPDQNGTIEIEGVREKGFLSRVHFLQLMLEKEK